MEKEIQEFLSELSEIEKKYQDEEKRKEQFNIFTALHKESDERRLHSRFISYLLSPKSNHGKGKNFLKLFVEEIPEINFVVNESCKVRPNEQDKSEYKNIDILVENDKKQAIIIENKIFAGDSNHSDEEAENQIQLVRYHDKLIKEGYEAENIFVIYLTLDRHKPDRWKEIDFSVCLIDYRTEIKKWIENCKKETQNEPFLGNCIQQYLDLTIKITNNVQKALELKGLISKYIGFAWENKEKIIVSDDFKHVKWHTVHEFWEELAKEKEINAKIPETLNDDIAKVTHNNSKITKLIIRFTFGNEELQIVNDAKGFTLGNLTKGTWGYFSERIRNIKFCNFEDENTFHLINNDYRKEVINQIVNEIREKYDKLENTFK